MSGRGFNRRLGFRRRLRLMVMSGLGRDFGKRRIFEEVFAQGRFEVCDELTDDLALRLVLRDTESCGPGLADRLEFRLLHSVRGFC